MFNLDLKECALRFDNGMQNIYKIWLVIFRIQALKLS